MHILSIQIGTPKTIEFKGKQIYTAIDKKPVEGPVFLTRLGLKGDKQGDTKVHGGEKKALYALGFDSYAWWRTNHPRHDYVPGAFGENLTLSLLDETAIHVNDVFKVGGAVIQVTKPRMPCFTLSAKFQDAGMVKAFYLSRRPGIYFKVLQEGFLSVGDSLELIQESPSDKTILEAFFEKSED